MIKGNVIDINQLSLLNSQHNNFIMTHGYNWIKFMELMNYYGYTCINLYDYHKDFIEYCSTNEIKSDILVCIDYIDLHYQYKYAFQECAILTTNIDFLIFSLRTNGVPVYNIGSYSYQIKYFNRDNNAFCKI